MEQQKRISQLNKTELKQLAQDELLDSLSQSAYKIHDNPAYTDEEKQMLTAEMKKQMDRVARMFGY